jgi:hypothetical protein
MVIDEREIYTDEQLTTYYMTFDGITFEVDVYLPSRDNSMWQVEVSHPPGMSLTKYTLEVGEFPSVEEALKAARLQIPRIHVRNDDENRDSPPA